MGFTAMNSQLIRAVDNRDTDDMIEYLEASVAALRTRVRELEQQIREERISGAIREAIIVEIQGRP